MKDLIKEKNDAV